MAKLKFKDENDKFIPVVQDVKVNNKSVFDEKEANINLKTINNQSIVGSGNIDIQGGEGEYVKYSPNQNLTTQQKTNARNNISALGTNNIKQQTGDSATDVISQKGMTDELNKKQNAKPDGRTNLIATDTGKLNVKYLPATVLGGITYGGTFNDRGYITASSYAPELDGRDIRNVSYGTYPSFYFIYSGPTTVNFFGSDYSVGDMALSTLNGWAHLNSTDAVTSVNGKIGSVIINADDIEAVYRYWGTDNANKNLVTNEFGEVTVSDYSLGQIIVDYYQELPNVNPDLPHQNIPERARATVLHPSDEIMRYDNSQLQNAFDSGEELGHDVKIYWSPERPTASPQYVYFDDGIKNVGINYSDDISEEACYWLEYWDDETGDSVWYTFSWAAEGQKFTLDESGNTRLLYDTWTRVKYDSSTDTYSSKQAQWGDLPIFNNPVYVTDLLLEDNIFAQSFMWLDPKLAGEYTYFKVEPETTPTTYYWGYTPSNVQADMAETDPSQLSYIRNITLLDTTASYNLNTESAEELRGTIQLHKISKTGNYSDLRNQVGRKDESSNTGEIFNSYSGNSKNVASGTYSHSEGYSNSVLSNYTHAEGLSNSLDANSQGSHAEGGRHTMSSNYGHAEGYQNIVSGYAGHAEGNLTSAIGSQSHAEGISCTASAQGSHAEGYGSYAGGSYSHAEGQSTSAGGANSHAEGQSTSAGGHCSHTEGYNTRTSADYTHAEGSGSSAQGSYSHAEGWSTLASGAYTHAEGRSTSALSYGAHAEGEDTTAAGSWSHAEGKGTIAQSELQHVQGKYNISDGYGTYVHIVGNGTDTNNRSNAHTVDWNGNAWFAGDIRIGGKDYSTALSMNKIIQELRDNSIKGTSTGTTVTLTDSYPTPLLDYKIYGNSETSTPKLPNEYQEVEYIEGTGTQAIDTGYNATNKEYKAVLDTQFTQASTTSQVLVSAGINAWCGQIQNVYGIGGSYKTTISSLDRASLEFIGNYENGASCCLRVNNEEVIRTYVQNEGNVSLFAGIGQQTIFSYHSKAKLYSAKLYDENNTLIRDFIPCYRKSDSTIGLYDIVNNVFYTNAGTGTFIKGNNKYPPIYSVGDLVQSGEHQGEYKVPIRMSGKNLFDKDNITIGAILLEDGSVQTGSPNNYSVSDYMPIKPNTAYYKTVTGSPRIKYYNKNKQALDTTTYQDIDLGISAGTFTTPSNAYYLRITNNTNNMSLDTIQIEKGTSVTQYEPYIQPIETNIYLDAPLRKVQDNADYIDFSSGKLIRNVAEIASYNGESITTDYISTTGGLDIGATVDYVIEPTEETIELPDITPIANTCMFETDTDVLGTLDITYIKDTTLVVGDIETLLQGV